MQTLTFCFKHHLREKGIQIFFFIIFLQIAGIIYKPTWKFSEYTFIPQNHHWLSTDVMRDSDTGNSDEGKPNAFHPLLLNQSRLLSAVNIMESIIKTKASHYI